MKISKEVFHPSLTGQRFYRTFFRCAQTSVVGRAVGREGAGASSEFIPSQKPGQSGKPPGPEEPGGPLITTRNRYAQSQDVRKRWMARNLEARKEDARHLSFGR